MSKNAFELAADGWVQISPLGDFPHAGAGVTQVVDREACDRIAAEFNGLKADPNYPGVLVDFDHFSLDTEKSSEAAGWITELEARDDGLWARVRWSDAGLAAVTGGRFRLVSPVFPAPAECEDLGGGRIRPVRLVSVALTNEPNIKGGRPLANRQDGPTRTSFLPPAADAGYGSKIKVRSDPLPPVLENKIGGEESRGGAEELDGKEKAKGDVLSGPGAKRFCGCWGIRRAARTARSVWSATARSRRCWSG